MKKSWGCVLVFTCAGGLTAQADIVSNVMSSTYGYNVVASEVGVSGLTSSYHGLPMSNAAYNAMPTLGPSRVSYPSGVGNAPSPGGNTGRPFDQGGLGYKISGGNITFGLATGLNPASWTTTSGSLFGQGDLFLDVLSASGMSHYALLNNMNNGANVGHGGYFTGAQAFRSGAGPSVGEMVKINGESDVLTTGVNSAYIRGSNSPAGLDERLFAKGGTDLNVGSLSVASFTADQPLGSGGPMTWYLMQWTVPVSIFGDGPIQIALHSAASCGNDQIGGFVSIPLQTIPSPAAATLGLIGLAFVGRLRRNPVAR